MKFTKMHGLGNDYVYVNCFQEHVADPAGLARILSDRHTGVGADGLILIKPSEQADVRMEIYNADGSRAQMCGNGIRCVAKYAFEHGLVPRSADGHGAAVGEDVQAVLERTRQAGRTPAAGWTTETNWEAGQTIPLTVQTDAGVKVLGLFVVDGRVRLVCVNMGRPSLRPADLPSTLEQERIVDCPVSIRGQPVVMTCVSVGNPHAVIFVDEVRSVDLVRRGPAIENAPVFPQRINVHFVQVNARSDVTMITWERGSGVTQACGTGAAAVCVAGAVTNRTDRTLVVHLPGGDLHLSWASDDHVYMTGPAVEVFSGEWPD